jgi:dimethylhistidine N-methyltransferase
VLSKLPVEPRLLTMNRVDRAALAADAAAGLRAQPATIAPKFFYDALGSRLFEAITALPEYYLTRTEAEIFDSDGPEIAREVLAAAGPAPVMVDLGAGSGAKAARLFGRLAPRRYVAVDFAVDFLRDSLRALQRVYPDIEMIGVGQDFSAALHLPQALASERTLVFYPGSSVGNFSPGDAERLLREARGVAAGGALLIGVDLVKPAEVLEAAYDDALGVTAAFNRNVLLHLNRLLGADFDLRQWRHVARFDERASRIEMHLEAVAATAVRWPGGERRFAAGERIHTENSYKWTPDGFGALLKRAGYASIRHWTDPRGWFAVFVATA